MKNLLILLSLVATASCLSAASASANDGFPFVRTDSAGVEYVDALYWYYAWKLRPRLEKSHPSLRIWLSGVIGDELAAANGFTKIVSSDGNRFPLIRLLTRYRIFRWIALLAALKIILGLFVVVVLPNIYFMARMMTD